MDVRSQSQAPGHAVAARLQRVVGDGLGLAGTSRGSWIWPDGGCGKFRDAGGWFLKEVIGLSDEAPLAGSPPHAVRRCGDPEWMICMCRENSTAWSRLSCCRARVRQAFGNERTLHAELAQGLEGLRWSTSMDQPSRQQQWLDVEMRELLFRLTRIAWPLAQGFAGSGHPAAKSLDCDTGQRGATGSYHAMP